MSSTFLVVSLGLLALVSGASIGNLNVCKQFGWPTGTYPHPSDCSKFIMCGNGITTEISCPNSTVFDPISHACDIYSNAKICSGSGSMTTIDVTDVCNLYSWGNGIHYHPYDCSKYIECTFGRTNIMACPTRLYYHPAAQTPNSAPPNPYCSQYVSQAPIGSTPAGYPAGWDTYCQNKNMTTGIHPDPFSCLHFIECTFGVTNHMACPAGTAFNPTLSVCDDNANVNCPQVVVG
ncbi:probable endochitinase [Aplysia californica]|uniref:Probable endochitinase n=1 Tax=Aplysia californica TaxID=6500 RepID=A0ABM1A4J0_APLCA|nr:probable endochitinase [Aplysia californica]